jgi:CRISPR-associated protein Csm1
MDVDDLGRLFQYGFGQGEGSRASLARISTLSFQLSLFFEGWVKRLCERHANLIYAVYAGGDDVFLIGPWDRMPGLAREIAADFQRYTGGNPDAHISGGLAFIHGKYPVYQAAEDAKESLDKAKEVTGKDAFSFLGQAWKWQDFDQVVVKFDRLVKLVGDSKNGGLGGPQAILQTLRQLAQDEADKAKRSKGRPVWGPWMWHGAYQLTRMAERARNLDLKKELVAIHDELSKNNYGEIAQWGLAARWAQLWLREKE